MLALKITDVKDFMNKLLIGEVFDRFSLVEASVTTFNTFTINGKLHYDFFDTDTKAAFEENSTEYSLWHDVKPYCFSIIRGRRTPLNFRIVFEASHDQTQSLLKNERYRCFSLQILSFLQEKAVYGSSLQDHKAVHRSPEHTLIPDFLL